VTLRQPSVCGHAGPAWKRPLGALLVFLMLAGCNSSSPVSDQTATAPSTSAVPSTTSTSAASTTTTTAPDPLEEDLLAAWDAFWQAWSAVRASETLDPALLQQVADPDVVEGVIALFERQRESGLGPMETDVATHAKVTTNGPDEAAVEDCVLVSPSFTESTGVWYLAQLRSSGQGWVVTDLRVPAAGGCVPGEIAEAAIAAYEAFYDGWAEFWDPADPDHPLLDAVLADPQRTLIVDLLGEHEARGAALRGRPATYPEVIEVRSPTELVILSCLEPDPAYGLYDLDTGVRLDDVPVVREGQRNLESAVMVLEGGQWKVSDLQGQVDFACEFAPTDRGLPSV